MVEYLATNRTLYFHPDGDNLADGSEGDPLRDLQVAYDKAADWDFNYKTVTLQQLPSECINNTGDLLRVSYPWRGYGIMRIRGDLNNPQNCKLTANAGNVFKLDGAMSGTPINGGIFIEGFEVSAPNGAGIRHVSKGDISLGNMRWGTCGNAHYQVEWFGANIRNHGPHTIVGGAQQHVQCDCGAINVTNPISIIGNITFAQTIYAQHGGYMLFNSNASWDLTSGSVTGKRYVVREMAVIQKNSSIGWEIPGTLDGLEQSGGKYI